MLQQLTTNPDNNPLCRPDGTPLAVDWDAFPETMLMKKRNYANTEWLTLHTMYKGAPGIYGDLIVQGAVLMYRSGMWLSHFENGYIGWTGYQENSYFTAPWYFNLRFARAYDVTSDAGISPFGNYTLLGVFNPDGELSYVPEFLRAIKIDPS